MSPWEARAPLTGGRHRAVHENEEGGGLAASPFFAFNARKAERILSFKKRFLLFEENKANDQRDCCDGNNQECKLESMLFASFT